MNDYKERIGDALAKGDAEAAEAAARAAFDDEAVGEDDLAWVAAMMYENDIRGGFDLLEAFVERFPESLHLGRVYLADVFAQVDQFDDATEQARIYLRQAQERDVLHTLAENRLVQDGVSRACLLLTAAYTELGARSYSARVLRWAAQFTVESGWAESIRNERLRLIAELKEPANGKLDAKWEQFFASGRHVDELCKICADRGFPLMAQRLALLEANFRFNMTFNVGEQEILQLVLATDGDQHVLG
jgi:hypothetical protein